MKRKKDFDKLPIAEQRVIIAKDLIAQLDAKKFTARSGTYLAGLSKRDVKHKSVELRTVLAKKRCRGCQLGGMFVCAVDRHNALKIEDLQATEEFHDSLNDIDSSDMRAYLRRWFSADALTEIESAFEGDFTNKFDFSDWNVSKPAVRMRFIAQNIIKNKGRFVPEQLLKMAAAKAG